MSFLSFLFIWTGKTSRNGDEDGAGKKGKERGEREEDVTRGAELLIFFDPDDDSRVVPLRKEGKEGRGATLASLSVLPEITY